MGKKKKNQPALQTSEKSSREHLLAVIILIAAVMLAYSNSLNGTWAMDDVVANKPVGISDIKDIAGFRKLASLTFSINHYLAPFSPAYFRLVNILIHIFNSLLIYLLAYRTMALISTGATDNKKHLPAKDEKTPFYTALASSMLFALHPLNINAVAYIVQRMASLAAMFVLLSLVFYITASFSIGRLKAGVFYLFSAVSLLAGILSKENAVMAVPLILLYDYIFLARFRIRPLIGKITVISGIGAISIGLTSYYLGFHRTFMELIKMILHLNQPLKETGWMAVDVYWTPLQHILTEFRVVSKYISLIFVPLPGLLVFDNWGYPLSKGIISPFTTLLSIIFILGLLIFSVLKVRRLPLLCFGILWFITAISLESFFALGSDLYYEHRNYLPLSGLLIGIAGQAFVALKERADKKTVLIAIAVLSLTLGSMTFMRNFVWKDSVTLWEDTLRKNPSNIRALMSLGNAYMKLPDFGKAKGYYKEALRISNQDKRLSFLNGAVYRLGMTYLFEKDLKEAKRLIDLMEGTIESYNVNILKGFYKASIGDPDSAVEIYRKVLPETNQMDALVVYTLMGDAYRDKGMWDKAIESYSRAIAMDATFAAAYYGTGVAYLAKRNIGLAKEYLSKTLSIEPDNLLALSDMADILLPDKARLQDAFKYAQRAVSRPSPFYLPYLTMGNVLIVAGNEKEAEEYYKKALERGLQDYMIPFSKARAYYVKGDMEKAGFYYSELKKYRLPEKFKVAVSR